jgi:hypothetical protein
MQSMLRWESNKYYVFWVCVFIALGIQHAMRAHNVVVCGLSGLQYFFILSYKRYDFESIIEHKMCLA